MDNLCSGKVVDNLMNVETVKNFDTRMIETRDYNNLLVDYQIESQKSELNSAALNAGQALILSAGATAILLTIILSSHNYAGKAASALSASVVGGIVMANGLLLQVSAPLQFLGFFYRELRQSLVDIQDIFDILNTKTKVPQGEMVLQSQSLMLETDHNSNDDVQRMVGKSDNENDGDSKSNKYVESVVPTPTPLGIAGGGIDVVVNDVWFAYPNRDPLLKGVSIHARAGERIALVGPSGSGKSTLLRLICRQYDVDEGCVLLDGVDVRHLKERSLRDAIGVVPQESAMFSGTLESNIRYGSSSLTMQAPDLLSSSSSSRSKVSTNANDNDSDISNGVLKEERDNDDDSDDDQRAVMAALRLSQLSSVVDKAPAGLQTVVGDRGFTLSGGERQRVALARVFLREPRLLLCDEATSALDSGTEQLILGAIRELSRGRTAITVAHRLSTIVDCDRIYVMRDGVVEEFGTHDELMAMSAAVNQNRNDDDIHAVRQFTGLYRNLWELQSKEENLPFTMSFTSSKN